MMLTVDTILPICSHNSRKMLVFISLFFCLALSSVSATCPDKWVDASEYDLGNLKLSKIVDLRECSRMPPPARQGTEPQAAQLGRFK